MRQVLFWFFNILFVIINIPILAYLHFHNNRKLICWCGNLWAKTNLWIISHKYNLVGHLPDDYSQGGYAIYANHQSIIDIFVLLHLFNGNIGFVAKKEIGKIPFIGVWIHRLGGVLFDRSSIKDSTRAIVIASNNIKKNYNVAIFPEGTRNIEIKEFQTGSFKMALKSKAKIIPITISGTNKSYELSGKKFTKGQSKITIHDTITYDKYQTMTMEELNKLVYQKIKHPT